MTGAAGALGERHLDALREVGNIGAGTAATALSQMIGGVVTMGVPRVEPVPVEQVADLVGGGEALVAAVFLGVVGDAEGHMLVLMREPAARRLVASLLGDPGGRGEFDAMGMSVLQEVGNVLTSAYLGALALLTGMRLEPTPPAVGVDMAGALLGSALAEVAMTSSTALLIDSGIGTEAGPVGDVLFIPGPRAMAEVLARLGVAA